MIIKKNMQSIYLALTFIAVLFCASIAIYTWDPFRPLDFTDTKATAKWDELQAVRVINDAFAFYNTEEGKAIWPEYNPNEQPLIITFDNGHIYAFNLNSHNPAWETLNIFDKNIKYSEKDNWEVAHIQLQADYPIDGIPAFVFHIDLVKENPIAPFLILLHERFHVHQRAHFAFSKNNSTEYVDHFDAENLVLMHIEEMILADFMNSQLDETKSHFHKAAVLNDLIAVNQMRKRLLKPSSIAWENTQQKIEGLADYVSIQSFGQFPFVKGFNSTSHILGLLQESTMNEEILERTVKWRHYSVGAALGCALDFLEVPDWKIRISNEKISQMEILEEQIHLSEEEIAARMEKIKSRYSYESIKNQLESSINHYQDEIANLMDEFHTLKGVKVEFGKPKNLHASGGGSALYVYYLDDGSTLSLADTSNHTAANGKWNVQLEGAPMILKRADGSISIKLEPDAEVEIDGEKHRLAILAAKEGEYSFQKLIIKGNHSEFTSTLPGRVVIKEGSVLVGFPENVKE